MILTGTWRDLSDSELRAKLEQRGWRPTAALEIVRKAHEVAESTFRRLYVPKGIVA